MIAKNFAYGIVATAPSPANSGTSLVLTTGQTTRFPDADTEGEYYVTACPPGEDPTLDNAEVLKVTADNTGTETLTIVRAQLSTAAKNIAVGWRIFRGIYVEDLQIVNGLYGQSLINGGFDIWQRGVTFTPNDDVYTADRWNILTETNGAWTIAQSTDVPAGLGFKYSAKLTNVTQNNQVALVQIIENVDAMKLDDQAVSLSFYAKTTGTEIGKLRAAILSWSSTADSVTSDVIGTWAQDGTNPTWAANWTAENTPSDLAITADWQRFTIENVNIDTASMANIAVVIWVDDGTIAANDDLWITGVQLNQGAIAKSWQPKRFEEELSACMRYFEKSQAYTLAPSNGGDATTLAGHYEYNTGYGFAGGMRLLVRFSVRKRTTPTITAYGNNSSQWGWGSFGWIAPVFSDQNDGSFSAYQTSQGSSGVVYGVYGHWIASAEL